MGEEFSQEAAWTAALRLEAWAGEVRTNLIRLVAIAALFGNHLLNRYGFRIDLPAGYHAGVTAIAGAWTLGALSIHIGLSRRWNPPWLKFAALAFDTLMITALLLLSDGPRGAFTLLLFLLIGTAPLRLDLGLVRAATLLAIAAFGFACGHDRWVRKIPDQERLPRHRQVIVVIGLACAGLLAGQATCQARRFARDFADRLKPGGPAA